MPVALRGNDYGKNWQVVVEPSVFGGFIAYIQIGAKIKAVTEPLERFELYDDAKQAGCDLFAATFDELEAEVCNA